MYILKSFLRIDSLVNNTPGFVSQIGELSDYALTYSKDKGYYADAVNYPGVELISFTSKSDDSGVELPINVPPRVSEFMFQISLWMNTVAAINPQWFNGSQGTTVFLGQLRDFIETITSSNQNSLPGNITSYDDVVINAVSSEYSTVTASGLNKSYVHWMDFNINYVYIDGATEHVKTAHVKLWLSDESFRQMYDDYEIFVVPMVDNLDDFFDSYTNVNNMVTAAKEPMNVITRMEAAKGIHPFTIQKTPSYNWHDGMTPPNTISVPWGILIYGIAGDNLDLIREALREYILQNSTHDDEDWGVIFPGIFRTTEFFLIPMWDRFSIPNATLTQGIYSPVVSLFRDKTKIEILCPNFDEEYIEEHAESFTFPYKSIGVYSIPSEFNIEGMTTLQKAVPNWIHTPTSSLDYSRMNLSAQAWLSRLTAAFPVAENMTITSTLPANMTRVYRNGKMFLATELEEKTYLIMSKAAFKSEFPDDFIASEE